MEFALIISGPSAPTPAPRVQAVPSATGIGVYDHATQETWQPARAAIRSALPYRWRKAYDRASGPWYDADARMKGGKCVPTLPYMSLYGRRGRHLANVYFAPVVESAA